MPLSEEEKRQHNIEHCRKYRKDHIEERRAKERQYTRDHPMRSRKVYYNLKKEVLAYYSNSLEPKCLWCGEKRLECLSIDHINGGGSEERRNMKKYSNGFYQYLKVNKFPDGYQTLCMNCQFVKRAHEMEKRRKDYKET